MMCFYRMGSRPLALRQYQRCAETLRAEMDLEPMAETRELRDRILEGRADLR
jgi:DNA-binding SARP family transcriptional activator